MFQSLDKQSLDLPVDVVFCANCVVSNQRPRIAFNSDGICSACQWAYEKDHGINWESRAQELEALCDRYRSKDGSFDVVVPGSGGKDSGWGLRRVLESPVHHGILKSYSSLLDDAPGVAGGVAPDVSVSVVSESPPSPLAERSFFFLSTTNSNKVTRKMIRIKTNVAP